MTQIDTGELQRIALKNINGIPAARGDTSHAYVEKVLMWLAEWCGAKQFRESTKPGYCALVLAPEIPGDGVPNEAEVLSYFKEDSTPQLGGSVYITDYAINQVYRCRNNCTDLDEVIRVLKANGLDNRPFVAFDTDSQAVYVFEQGATKMTYQFPLRVDLPRPFTIGVFEEMLEDIYTKHLKYPDGYPPVWHDPKDRVPCKETELVIQGHVACILRARAQGSKASSSESEWLTLVEEKNNAGRADLAVYRHDKCVVVSEIKVLRHCHFPDLKKRKEKALEKADNQRKAAVSPNLVSAKTNERWALRGARQAAGYKVATKAKSAALLLYDMRTDDQDIAAAQKKCETDNVRYLRYYLRNELPAEA